MASVMTNGQIDHLPGRHTTIAADTLCGARCEDGGADSAVGYQTGGVAGEEQAYSLRHPKARSPEPSSGVAFLQKAMPHGEVIPSNHLHARCARDK